MIKRKQRALASADNGPACTGSARTRPARTRPARTEDDGQLRLSSATGLDGGQVVSVTGELDIATAPQAYSYLSAIISQRGIGHGEAAVRIDLTGLTFCDASGLSVFARIARKAHEAGRQLMLTGARPSLLKLIRITGLDSAFPELCSPAVVH